MSLSAQSLQERLPAIQFECNPADENLARLVRQAFCDGRYRELRQITCTAHEGCVTLNGAVDSYWLKQLAQTEIQSVPGVELIQNKIVVSR